MNITDEVVTVSDGLEALEFLQNQGAYSKEGKVFPKPELIFLDINMPKMNGWEFLDAYDELPDTMKSSIIIVMLTTSVNPDDKTRMQEKGYAKEYLNKPLRAENVENILRIQFPDRILKE